MAKPSLRPDGACSRRWREWLGKRPELVLGILAATVLGMFLSKPFHLDDPLFIRAAQHIQAHPGDPYGFMINWAGYAEPMWNVTKNPPVACYYLAGWAGLAGWSEPAVHLGFLIPALAAIVGIFRLARLFCARPLLAAIAALFTPVFLVSSTTVMCDVMMLAFWVWSAVLWIEGARRGDVVRLLLAALLAGVAALTKYFAASLIPLLLVWSLLFKASHKRWIALLLVPVAMLAAYQMATHSLYGQGLFSDAGVFAAAKRGTGSMGGGTALLVALSFAGGCLASIVFFAPMLWSRRVILLGFAGTVLLAVVLCGLGFAPFLAVQMAVWAAGGIQVLALAVVEVIRHRNADAWFLVLWLGGTFLFAAAFNWTINGRTILPMIVPAGILMVRRWTAINPDVEGSFPKAGAAVALLAGATLAILVTRADFLFAAAARQSADQALSRHSAETGRSWFAGHWGFQYYLENAGASAFDFAHPAIQPGDWLLMPSDNTSVFSFERLLLATRQSTVSVSGPEWLATFNSSVGAGFYACSRGPLPFAFGRVPPMEVAVFRVDALRENSR